MQITCPKCATSYRIADNAIGGGGRSVHCVRCDQVWRVEPDNAPAVAAKIEVDEAAFRKELGKEPAPPSPAVTPAAEPPPHEAVDEKPDAPSPDDRMASPETAATAAAPTPEPAAKAEESGPAALS